MHTAEMIDAALDRSVVLGYANIGLEVRKRLPGWPAGPSRMDGKVVLVTGAGPDDNATAGRLWDYVADLASSQAPLPGAAPAAEGRR